jgi:hypothetical protein
MCDLNIMGTCMEASVHLFQNWGMTGGIRINVFEALREENAQIFYILSCREGKLPIKHMHILVSDKMLYSADLIGVGVKVEKRLPAWQGLYLSSRRSQF